MALSLKYRLLCGSVVLTSPLMYHEWYYSQLKDGEHLVSLDATWSDALDVLSFLRADDDATGARAKGIAEKIGAQAKQWAQKHLTEDGFDCYWLNLITLANEHFPAPEANWVGQGVTQQWLAKEDHIFRADF